MIERTFKITGKLTIREETLFDIKTEQDVYNELRNRGFFDLHIEEER